MIGSFVVLLAWMAGGLFIAATRSAPGEGRFAWAPLAMLLGPLWWTIAVEREAETVS